MNMEFFATQQDLKVTRDGCGDSIIRGKRSHLFMDAGELCAMWTDAPAMRASRLAALGGRWWQGDISFDGTGRRVQDAWVRGMSRDKIGDAIRLVGAKRKRKLSPAQRASLEKACGALRQGHKSGLLCDAGGRVKG